MSELEDAIPGFLADADEDRFVCGTRITGQEEEQNNDRDFDESLGDLQAAGAFYANQDGVQDGDCESLMPREELIKLSRKK